MAGTQIDYSQPVDFGLVQDNDVPVCRPDFITRVPLRFLRIGLDTLQLLRLELLPEDPLLRVLLHPPPAEQCLDFLPQLPSWFPDAPDQRPWVEPVGLAATPGPFGDVRLHLALLPPLPRRVGYDEGQPRRVLDFRRILWEPDQRLAGTAF